MVILTILTENLNILKKRVNSEKQSRCDDPAHLDPVSSDEEALPVPLASAPVASLPLSSDQLPTTIAVSQPPTEPPAIDPSIIPAHVSTVSPPLTSLVPAAMQSLGQTVPTPGLSPAEWSALIAKAQTDRISHAVPVPHGSVPPHASLTDNLPPTKIFTVEAASFSIDPEPGAILDSLLQMALSHVFIPLSMLTMVALNNIETNRT